MESIRRNIFNGAFREGDRKISGISWPKGICRMKTPLWVRFIKAAHGDNTHSISAAYPSAWNTIIKELQISETSRNSDLSTLKIGWRWDLNVAMVSLKTGLPTRLIWFGVGVLVSPITYPICQQFRRFGPSPFHRCNMASRGSLSVRSCKGWNLAWSPFDSYSYVAPRGFPQFGCFLKLNSVLEGVFYTLGGLHLVGQETTFICVLSPTLRQKVFFDEIVRRSFNLV
ncbi:hypothetical protein Tco_0768427 [Tanacetum coccineum]